MCSSDAQYLGDADGFARRYFGELFARLPVGSRLLLDNYQEVRADQSFQRLIAQGIEEIPPGITLLVLSRNDPSESTARLVANESVGFIDYRPGTNNS